MWESRRIRFAATPRSGANVVQRGCQEDRFMKNLAMLICLAAFALLGCHKKEAATATPSAPPGQPDAVSPGTLAPDQSQAQTPRPASPAEPAQPLPRPPAYVTANADNNLRQGVVGQVDPSLTSALRAFSQKKGRLPQSFFEFTAGGLDTIPRPPEGKKWVIDTSDLTVKAVANK